MDDTRQKTTIIVDKAVHKRLRLLAIELDTSFNAIVEEAIDLHIERLKRELKKGKKTKRR